MFGVNDDQALRGFQAVARDLEQVVHEVAARYIARQIPLTWRLLHAIAAESLAQLGSAGRHEPSLLRAFESPADLQQSYPENDELAGLGQSNVCPAVFSFVIAAYENTAGMLLQPKEGLPARTGRGIYAADG